MGGHVPPEAARAVGDAARETGPVDPRAFTLVDDMLKSMLPGHETADVLMRVARAADQTGVAIRAARPLSPEAVLHAGIWELFAACLRAEARG